MKQPVAKQGFSVSALVFFLMFSIAIAVLIPRVENWNQVRERAVGSQEKVFNQIRKGSVSLVLQSVNQLRPLKSSRSLTVRRAISTERTISTGRLIIETLNSLNSSSNSPSQAGAEWKFGMLLDDLGQKIQRDKAAWPDGIVFYKACAQNQSLAVRFRDQCRENAQALQIRIGLETQDAPEQQSSHEKLNLFNLIDSGGPHQGLVN